MPHRPPGNGRPPELTAVWRGASTLSKADTLSASSPAPAATRPVRGSPPSWSAAAAPAEVRCGVTGVPALPRSQRPAPSCLVPTGATGWHRPRQSRAVSGVKISPRRGRRSGPTPGLFTAARSGLGGRRRAEAGGRQGWSALSRPRKNKRCPGDRAAAPTSPGDGGAASGGGWELAGPETAALV